MEEKIVKIYSWICNECNLPNIEEESLECFICGEGVESASQINISTKFE